MLPSKLLVSMQENKNWDFEEKSRFCFFGNLGFFFNFIYEFPTWEIKRKS